MLKSRGRTNDAPTKKAERRNGLKSYNKWAKITQDLYQEISSKKRNLTQLSVLLLDAKRWK